MLLGNKWYLLQDLTQLSKKSLYKGVMSDLNAFKR